MSEPRQFRDCMIPHRAEEMSNKQHVQKKNLKVSKNVLRKEVDKLRDNWINAGPGVPGVDPEVALDRLRFAKDHLCLLYTSPSPRDATLSRMPSSA